MTWQLQQAKARLSEVIQLARTQGPQPITLHGRPAAVIISAEEYERLTRKPQSFVEFMRGSPLVGAELHIERDTSPPRKVEL